MRNLLVSALILFLFGVCYVLIGRQSPMPVVISKASCQLSNTPCTVSLPGHGRFTIALNPMGLPAMEPLQLKMTGLDISPENIKDMKLWFQGRDMYMGQHFLQPDLPKSIANEASMEFDGMIPVCTVDNNMVWQLVIEMPEALFKKDGKSAFSEPRMQQIQVELLN